MMMTETTETNFNGTYHNEDNEQIVIRSNGLKGSNRLWRVTTFMFVTDGYGRTSLRERVNTYNSATKLRAYLNRKGFLRENFN